MLGCAPSVLLSAHSGPCPCISVTWLSLKTPQKLFPSASYCILFEHRTSPVLASTLPLSHPPSPSYSFSSHFAHSTVVTKAPTHFSYPAKLSHDLVLPDPVMSSGIFLPSLVHRVYRCEAHLNKSPNYKQDWALSFPIHLPAEVTLPHSRAHCFN
jgi:hypothetical protein